MVFRHRVLVVDDEASVRESLESLLTRAGYDVSTAEHGFDALLQLRTIIPEVIICDLNMPQMSGFELLSVIRRRFPVISVIAVSGAYDSGEEVPNGVIAGVFYSKGRHSPDELLHAVAKLVQTSRSVAGRRQSAPVWIPQNGVDSRGVPYIVLTCTECLRSFPVSVLQEGSPEIQETSCLFCTATVRYIIDFSRSVSSPRNDIIAETSSKKAANGKP